MLPSPSLGPPLLSASPSPPPPCGIPGTGEGDFVLGAGDLVVIGGVADGAGAGAGVAAV